MKPLARKIRIVTQLLVAAWVASLPSCAKPNVDEAAPRATQPQTVARRTSQGPETGSNEMGKSATANNPDALYNSGLNFQTTGNLTAAIDAYKAALAIDQNHSDAHNNLAAALAANQQFDLAIHHFRRVIEVRPDFPQGHVNLGNALMTQNMVEDAIVHYRRAVELNPSYAKAHNNLAVALKRSGQLDQAYRHMQEALRLKRASR